MDKKIRHNLSMALCNNYRKLHGAPTRRWRQLVKVEKQTWRAMKK